MNTIQKIDLMREACTKETGYTPSAMECLVMLEALESAK